MDTKSNFYEWWLNNGSPGKSKAWEMFIMQGKPISGMIREEIRNYIEEFNGGNNVTYIPVKDLDNREELLKSINNGKSVTELKNIYKKSEKAILKKVEELITEGYNITFYNDIVKLEKSTILKENKIKCDWTGQDIIRFGIVSDTHLCSKYQQLTHLNSFYDICSREGIETIYHAMDISEGYSKRRAGHIYELIPGCVGADEQSDYIIENYPKRKGIKTVFGTGNHDHWHIINGGVDIGRRIAKERDDMCYMGLSNYKVELTPNCIMEVNHPLDGSAYALSYSIQKYMDSIMGGEKPNILINGHHHKAMYLFYRNIHAIEAGCFEAQTPWMRGKRIAANVGGFIITVYVEKDGTIKRFIPEFIPYYKMIENDY